MKTPTASSATSSQREQTSLLSQMPRSPRSNVCSTPDPENPSASVHPKRFSTPSPTLKFLCPGKLSPRPHSWAEQEGNRTCLIRAGEDVPENDPGYVPIANRSAESFDIYSRSTPSSNFEIGSSVCMGLAPSYRRVTSAAVSRTYL